jgi:hypothetical protein
LFKAAGDYEKRAKEFNGELPRIQLDLRPEIFEPWLESCLDRQFDDAMSLYRVLGDSTISPPRRMEVALITARTPDDSVIDVPAAAIAVRPSNETRVHYRISDNPLQGWGFEELRGWKPEFEQSDMSGHAAVTDAIADISGYEDDDVNGFGTLRELGLLRRGPRS